MSIINGKEIEFFEGHLTTYQPPVRDRPLILKSLQQQDGLFSYSYEQEILIKNKDWSTNLANSCQYIAVAMGDFIFGKILMHTSMPIFSPSCFNLVSSSSSSSRNVHDEASILVTPPPITYLLVKMTIEWNFTESLRNSNSSDYLNLLASLKSFVKKSLENRYHDLIITDLEPGSIIVRSIISVVDNGTESEITNTVLKSLQNASSENLPVRTASIQVIGINETFSPPQSAIVNQNSTSGDKATKSKSNAAYVIIPIVVIALIGVCVAASFFYFQKRKNRKRYLIQQTIASMHGKNDEISFSEINNSTSTQVGSQSINETATTTTTMSKDLSGGAHTNEIQNDEIQLFDKKSFSRLNEIERHSQSEIKRISSFSEPPGYYSASKSTPHLSKIGLDESDENKRGDGETAWDQDVDSSERRDTISLAEVAKRRFSQQDHNRNLLEKTKSNSISESKEL